MTVALLLLAVIAAGVLIYLLALCFTDIEPPSPPHDRLTDSAAPHPPKEG